VSVLRLTGAFKVVSSWQINKKQSACGGGIGSAPSIFFLPEAMRLESDCIRLFDAASDGIRTDANECGIAVSHCRKSVYVPQATALELTRTSVPLRCRNWVLAAQ